MFKFLNFVFGGIIFIIGLIIESLITIFPCWILRLFGKDKASHEIYWKALPRMARFICRLLWVKVHVEGEENLPPGDHMGNYCYISNHQSIVEYAAYIGVMKLRMIPVAKAEIKKVPFIRSLSLGVGTIHLERNNIKSSIMSIRKGVEVLKSGEPVIIFPAGTRSRNDTLGDLKEGSFKLAFRAKSVLIPLVVRGSRQSLEDKHGWHRQHVYIKVLPQVPTAPLDKEGQKEVYKTVVTEMENAYLSLPVPREILKEQKKREIKEQKKVSST